MTPPPDPKCLPRDSSLRRPGRGALAVMPGPVRPADFGWSQRPIEVLFWTTTTSMASLLTET